MAYYYGWQDEYLEGLDVQTFYNYYQASRVIERQQQLNNISASISGMQKNTDVKNKLEKLEREIKSSFEVEVSSVNEKYLAEEMLKDGK